MLNNGSYIKLFRFGKVDVYFNLSTLLYIAIYAIFIGRLSGSNGFVAGAAIATLIVISILLHEIAHAVVGLLVRERVEKIEVSFVGGMCYFSKKIENPFRDIAVCLAGPLSNFGLFFLFNFIANLNGMGRDWELIWQAGANINLMLAIGNILPCYPFDGGQATLAFVKIFTKKPLIAQWVVAYTGFLGGFGMLVVAFLYLVNYGFNPSRMSAIEIFFFLFFAITGYSVFEQALNYLQTTVETARSKKLALEQEKSPVRSGITAGAKANPAQDSAISPHMSVADFIHHTANWQGQAVVPVLLEGYLAGIITPDWARNTPTEARHQPLERIFTPRRQLAMLYADEDIGLARQKLLPGNTLPVAVLNRDGTFFGLLNPSQLTTATPTAMPLTP